MRFTVTWTPQAENQLATLWANAPQQARQEITSAADSIDEKLGDDAESLGESRAGNRRILFVPPLVVIIEVLEPDRLVKVLSVGKASGATK